MVGRVRVFSSLLVLDGAIEIRLWRKLSQSLWKVDLPLHLYVTTLFRLLPHFGIHRY